MTAEKIDPARPTYLVGERRHWAELQSILEEGKIALSETWLGETTAFEHYFREIGRPPPRLRKLSYSIRPGGFFIKE